MRTMTTMALVLGLFAIGAAPAAQADDDRFDRRDRFERNDRSDRYERHAAYGKHGRSNDLKQLTRQLERATDELRADARKVAGRVDRREARTLRAIYRLERASDDLRHAVTRHGETKRGFHRDFRQVKANFRMAARSLDALPRDRELRRDIRRVDRLIDRIQYELDEQRFASRRWQRGEWFARR